MRISVVGLGKLGAPLAAVYAASGHDVVGVDSNQDVVYRVSSGRSPVFEPGLDGLLCGTRGRLRATSSIGDAVAATDITSIIVPTPSDANGGFALQYVLAAAASIGEALRGKHEPHLVVLHSTVLPGSTHGPIREVLEGASGRRLGPELGLCYNPEFVALGTVIRDLREPDFVLIGESDPSWGAVLEGLYRTVCPKEPPVVRMSLVNAELTKLAVNTFVTTKISYANMLAEVCERLEGADVDVVTAALGRDTRIGAKYLRGAVGYGGPCFPRDNLAFAHMARSLGAPAALPEATDALNRHQAQRLARTVCEHLPADGTAGVLGLAYKPQTDVAEESQGLLLAALLVERSVSVIVHDPAAMTNARRVLGDSVTYAASPADLAREADVLVVATAWPEFHDLGPDDLGRPRPVILDCWRILEPGRFKRRGEVVWPGVGRALDSASAFD